MGKNQSASNLTNIIQYNNGNIAFVSGSTTLMQISSSGAITTTGVISGSNALSASYAATASFVTTAQTASFVTLAQTASFVANAQSASNAVTAQTASFANAFTVAGTLTAQTLVVQTITSSVDFVTGSTRFGSILGNTHVFSGSVTMNPNGLFVSSSGRVGIGTTTPSQLLHLSSSSTSSTGIQLTLGSEVRDHYLVSTTPNISAGRDLGLLAWRSLTLKAGNGVGEGEIYVNAFENIYLNTSSSYTTRMFISSSGNVGIGTTTPNFSAGAAGSTVLTISATSSGRNGLIELNGTRTNADDFVAYMRFFNNAAATPLADIYALRGSSDVSGSLAIATSGTERIRITSAGVTQLKQATGQVALEIFNSSTSTGALAVDSDNFIIGGQTSKGLVLCTNNLGQEKMRITVDGNYRLTNTVFSTSTDVTTTTYRQLYPSTYDIAQIAVRTDGQYYAGAFSFRTADAANANVLVERMRIQSDGTIRINAGGATTSATLQLYADPTPSNGASIAVSYLGSGAYGPLTFGTGGSERMRITSGGDIQIGTFATAGNKYFGYAHTNGDIAGAGSSGLRWESVAVGGNYSQNIYIRTHYYNADSRNTIKAQYDGNVYNFNNSTTWNQTSDIRIKDNIRPITDSLNKICALNPTHFEYKNNPGKIKTGFIAQEFEQVFAGHVSESVPSEEYKDFIPEGEMMKSIDADLIPYLVKAIQELKAENDTLKEILQRNNIQ